jgi:hypothetical protein
MPLAGSCLTVFATWKSKPNASLKCRLPHWILLLPKLLLDRERTPETASTSADDPLINADLLFRQQEPLYIYPAQDKKVALAIGTDAYD